MDAEPLALGYVGCGFMAQQVHLPNLSSIPGSRLTTLAEARPLLARQVAARYGIRKVYSSHTELAHDPEVQAVGVSAGYAQQGEIAADLLRAGKHVLVEKPMAVSVRQAERILEAAREGGSKLMVAYMKRYDPGNLLAHDLVSEWLRTGEMGRVVYARSHGFCGDWLYGMDRARMITTGEPAPPAPLREHLPGWLPEEHQEGYVGYLQQYTHNLNLLRWLLGVEDEAGVRAVDLDPDGVTGVVVLDLGGARAVTESGAIEHHEWEEHTQVYFERGWVKVWSPPLLARQARARVEVYRGGESPSYTYPVAVGEWAYRAEAEHFVEAVRDDEPFRSSGEDTLTDVRLCEEIYRAHLGME